MENKMVRVPFAVEMAKKITNGEVNGNIVTRDGRNARVICWDKKSDSIYNIVALLDEKIMERILTYTIKGYEVDGKDSDNDLMLEIPKYMTFKDGDVIYTRTNEFWYVFIYMDNGKDKTYSCAALDEEGILWIEDNRIANNDEISELRFATEEEKQKLIDALKSSKEPKAKEYLKRFFGIEENPECKFTFKQDVLVRQNNKDLWCGAQFSHKELNHYVVFGGNYFLQCIPYNEQTAHLLGTDKDWEEEK